MLELLLGARCSWRRAIVCRLVLARYPLECHVDSWQHGILHLLIKHVYLLLDQGSDCLFNLLLHDLRQGLLHSLRHGLLYLDLQVFLRLHLLLKRVHLHMQLSELLVEFHVVFDDQVLLGLPGRRHLDWSGTLLFRHLFFGLFDFLLRLLSCICRIRRSRFPRRRYS